MKKPARDEAAPADELKPLRIRPNLIARALQESSQKPRQSNGGLFGVRLFGKFGWSGPRRFPDGTPIH
jgi:hypothetical protein